MRRILLASLLVGGLGAAGTFAPGAWAGELDEALSAKDLQTYFSPYLSQVRGCYVAEAGGRAATLRLELTVRPSGKIAAFRVTAPEVPPASLARFEACVRRRVPSWHLPVRAGFTRAVMPIVFHKTNVPGAGPIESCRDPRGCPAG